MNGVWKRCLLEPTPQKSRAMVNEKVGGITDFGGARQGRVRQRWKCELLQEVNLRRAEIRSS